MQRYAGRGQGITRACGAASAVGLSRELFVGRRTLRVRQVNVLQLLREPFVVLVMAVVVMVPRRREDEAGEVHLGRSRAG